jgi:hypothetical protein
VWQERDWRRVHQQACSMFRGLNLQVGVDAGFLATGNRDEVEEEKCSDGVTVKWDQRKRRTYCELDVAMVVLGRLQKWSACVRAVCQGQWPVGVLLHEDRRPLNLEAVKSVDSHVRHIGHGTDREFV